MDPGAPPQRPADQPRVGQRRLVAQLGVVERREVVHRDDRGGTARRRHDEVRPVHDVGGADEPLERRRVATRPHSACSGRAGIGSLARRHPGGQVCRDQAAPAPAHGVGPDVDARARRQRAERALAEGADAGGQPEQRRRIERDAQARRALRLGTWRRPLRS